MVSGAHKKGKVANHYGCWRDTWYISIEEEEMKSALGKLHSADFTYNIYLGQYIFLQLQLMFE